MFYHLVTLLTPALVVHIAYTCKLRMMLNSKRLFILGTSFKHSDGMSLGHLPLRCWFASCGLAVSHH